MKGVREEIAGCLPPWDEKQRMKQHKLFQKTVTQAILHDNKPDKVERIRENITRWSEGHPKCNVARGWGIATPLGRAAPRCLRQLEQLKEFLPPRVCAAIFRTMFNGWCTKRRFQQRDSKDNKCVFGCNAKAEDSIEHYCRCPATTMVLEKQLAMHVPPCQGMSFWMMDQHMSIDKVKCSALSCYAAYRAFNLYRTQGKATSMEVAVDAMKQFIIQAAGHTSELGNFLDNRWQNHLHFG